VTGPANPGAGPARRRRKAHAPTNQVVGRQPSKDQPRLTESRAASAAIKRKPPSRKQLLGALAAVATIIGVFSSGTALFDWFGSKVNPVTPPPAKIDARLTPPTLLSTHKPLGEYLRETNQSTTGLSDSELAEQGFVFLIGIHLQGNLGRNVFLNWSIVDNATGNPLQDPIYNQTTARFRPRGPDQSREWPIWVPSPPRRGKFELRATLIDERHLPLVEADSKPFALSKGPSP
jgi:hypothetical protein